ncbi:MAG: hypothetical protein AB7T49_13480 [Oligoflexales bacterium]
MSSKKSYILIFLIAGLSVIAAGEEYAKEGLSSRAEWTFGLATNRFGEGAVIGIESEGFQQEKDDGGFVRHKNIGYLDLGGFSYDFVDSKNNPTSSTFLAIGLATHFSNGSSNTFIGFGGTATHTDKDLIDKRQIYGMQLKAGFEFLAKHVHDGLILELVFPFGNGRPNRLRDTPDIFNATCLVLRFK